jgi:hypothetical protein
MEMHQVSGTRNHFGNDTFFFENIRWGLKQADNALVIWKTGVLRFVYDQRSPECIFAELEVKNEGGVHHTRHVATS